MKNYKVNAQVFQMISSHLSFLDSIFVYNHLLSSLPQRDSETWLYLNLKDCTPGWNIYCLVLQPLTDK